MDAELARLPLPAVVVERGVVVAANAAAIALGPHAEVGEPLVSWFDPADEAHVALAYHGREAHEPVFARLRGIEAWVEIHAPVLDAGGPDAEAHLVLLRPATDEKFVRGALDSLADSTFVVGSDGFGRWRSAKLRERSAQSDDEAARRPPGERIHPEDLPRTFEVFTPGAPDPARVVVRSRSVDDDDRWEQIEVVVRNQLHHDVLRGYLVQVHNLDDGRTIETTLAQADPELLSLTEAAPVGIAVTDPSGRFVYRNPAAQALLGPDVSSFGDLDWLDLARPAHRTALATAFDAALHDGVEHTISAAFVDDGGDRWLRLRIEPQQSALGAPKGLIVIIEDVSEQVATSSALAAAEERMRFLATHDSLTGLPNRAALNDELSRAADRHARASTALSVLFCDLDRFKPVNDRLGHAGGDAVLVEVAHRLQAAIRAADFVARLGGDEFVVLCETASAEDAVLAEITDRLDAHVREPIVVGGETVSVGISIGIATAPVGSVADPDVLLTEADEAMYRTKATRHSGRQRRSESA
jgi:diguanylate cyclase (GGDEF)-like protein/PAS domain S-box-containing protein